MNIKEKAEWVIGAKPYKDSAAAQVAQALLNAIEVLDELVGLKDLKEVEGKTTGYLKRQPLAWKKARDLLGDLEWCVARDDYIKLLEDADKLADAYEQLQTRNDELVELIERKWMN